MERKIVGTDRSGDHIRFLLSLRAAIFPSSSNINAIAANCLLEDE